MRLVVPLALALAAASALTSSPATAESAPAGDPAWYRAPLPAGATRLVRVALGQPLREVFRTARAGDVIELAPGVHRAGGGNLVLAQPGTAENWIIVKSVPAPGGERAVIDLELAGELTLSGSYTLFENIEVRRGRGNIVHVAPAAASVDNVVIRNCRIHTIDTAGPAGAAIKVNANNASSAHTARVYIEDCDVSGSHRNAVIDGVAVRESVVRNCDIHDPGHGSHGIFFKGGSTGILIEGNLIRGVRQNAALQLGGNTGPGLFDPAQPDREGVDQLARNNLIADCDDSVFEVRGVLRGRICHNTAVVQTGFAIVRLTAGSTNGGTAPSSNDGIEVFNNLIVSTAGVPQYARCDDPGTVNVRFGRQLWCGEFNNASSAGPGIPKFPLAGDRTSGAGTEGTILAKPRLADLTGRVEALARYRLRGGSPAASAGEATATAPFDLLARARPAAPALGAFEPD